MRIITTLLLFSQITIAQNFDFTNIYPTNESNGYFNCDIDSDGNLYIAGTLQGTVDVDPGDGEIWVTSVLPSVLIAKHSSDGALIWHKIIPERCTAKDLHIDNNGDLFIVGRITGEVNFEPTTENFLLDSGIGSDAYVLKMTADGEIIWVKKYITGPDISEATIVKTDSENNLYIGGTYHGKLNTNLITGQTFNLHSQAGYDVFVAKYDEDLNITWAESVGRTIGDTWIRDMVIDQNGSAFIVGDFRGEIDFDEDNEIPAVGEYDIFLAKHVPGFLEWEWFRTYGSNGNDIAAAMVFGDDESELIIGGNFEETIDFNVGGESIFVETDAREGVIFKVAADNGDMLAAQPTDTGGDGQILAMGKDEAGNLFTLGCFSNTLNVAASTDVLTTDRTFAYFIGAVNNDLEIASAFTFAENDYNDYYHWFDFFTPNQNLLIDTDGALIFTGHFPISTLLSLGNTSIELEATSTSTGYGKNSYLIKISDYIFNSTAEVTIPAILLFPNPGEDIVNIQTDYSGYKLSIFNVQGKLIDSFEDVPSSIDLSFLVAGIYLFEFEDGGKKVFKKWVKVE